MNASSTENSFAVRSILRRSAAKTCRVAGSSRKSPTSRIVGRWPRGPRARDRAQARPGAPRTRTAWSSSRRRRRRVRRSDPRLRRAAGQHEHGRPASRLTQRGRASRIHPCRAASRRVTNRVVVRYSRHPHGVFHPLRVHVGDVTRCCESRATADSPSSARLRLRGPSIASSIVAADY